MAVAPKPSREPAAAAIATLAVGAGLFWLGYESGAVGVGTRVAATAVAAWAALVTVAYGYLGRPIPVRLVVSVLGLVGYAVLALVSFAWGAAAQDAFTEFNRAGFYLVVLVFAAVAASAVGIAAVSDGLALGLAAIAAVGLASRLLPGVVSSHGYQALALIPQGEARLSYPVGYWNGLAVASALAVPLFLRAATAHRSAVVRGLAALPAPILACTIYLTSSRTGVVTTAVGCVLYFLLAGRPTVTVAVAAATVPGTVVSLYFLRAHHAVVDGPFGTPAATAGGRSVAIVVVLASVLTAVLAALVTSAALRWSPPYRVEFGLLIAGVLAVAVGVAAAHPVRLLQHFKRPPTAVGTADYVQAHLLSANGSGRWQLWQAAVDEWRTRPVLGRGAGSYRAWQTAHGRVHVFVRDAHSLYLQTLGELGVIGLALVLLTFLPSVGAIVATARLPAPERHPRAAAFSAFAAFAVAAGVDWMWQLPAVAAGGVAALGLTLAPLPIPLRRRRAAAAIAVGALAALALVLAQLIELGGQRELAASEGSARAGDLVAATTHANRAASAEPWSSRPYLQLALLAERRGRLGMARSWITEASRRADDDWTIWAVAARIDAEANDIAAARRALARARALNPGVSGWGSR